jgi:hypothetical protein
MKKMILFGLMVVLMASCASRKTCHLADGTPITKRQQKKIFKYAWDNSFGQMTEDEIRLIDGVEFRVDTIHP